MKNELWLADPRFLKDIKRHERKWKTVSYDVQNVLLALSADDRMISYLGKPMPGVPVGSGIWKIRKIASRSFPGKGIQSGFRMMISVTSHHSVCLELYHKSQQEHADPARFQFNPEECMEWYRARAL